MWRKRSKRSLCAARLAAGGWAGVLLAGEMEALVAAVLLRLARRDALRHAAGLDQLDRQARQASDGKAGEGRPVVAAQHPRQAVLAERIRQDRPDMGRIGSADRLAAEQKAAGTMAHREGLDVSPLASPKPASEVGGPDVVRCLAGGQGCALRCHWRRRWRGRVRPAIEGDADRARCRPGAPCRSSRQALSLRGPQLGWRWRTASSARATSRATVRGLVCGARERSASPPRHRRDSAPATCGHSCG